MDSVRLVLVDVIIEVNVATAEVTVSVTSTTFVRVTTIVLVCTASTVEVIEDGIVIVVAVVSLGFFESVLIPYFS